MKCAALETVENNAWTWCEVPGHEWYHETCSPPLPPYCPACHRAQAALDLDDPDTVDPHSVSLVDLITPKGRR